MSLKTILQKYAKVWTVSIYIYAPVAIFSEDYANLSYFYPLSPLMPLFCLNIHLYFMVVENFTD
jgi:hypothetical protein